MLSENELDLITIELETVGLDRAAHVYKTQWGIPVTFYMLDIGFADRGIVHPLYFHHSDFKRYLSGLDQEELFARALENTVKIFQITGKTLAEYFREMGKMPENTVRQILLHALAEKMQSVEKEHQPLCITGTLGIRGAVGALSLNVLQQTCCKFGMEKLLIGICNNDFALAFQDLPENLQTLQKIMEPYGKDLLGSKGIRQISILQYDSEKNELNTYRENM